MGKVFRKAFRILGLDERKSSWVIEQDFMEILRSMLHVFLPFSLVSLTELCSFWYGLKDLFTLHKLLDKLKLSLTIKTDDVTCGRKYTDLHGWLWVAQGANGLICFLIVRPELFKSWIVLSTG